MGGCVNTLKPLKSAGIGYLIILTGGNDSGVSETTDETAGAIVVAVGDRVVNGAAQDATSIASRTKANFRQMSDMGSSRIENKIRWDIVRFFTRKDNQRTTDKNQMPVRHAGFQPKTGCLRSESLKRWDFLHEER